MPEVEGLIVKMKADTSDYDAKLKTMQAQTVATSEKVKSSFAGMTTIVGATGLAISGFAMSAVKSSIEWGKAVDDLVDKTGMMGEEASKLLGIGKATGLSTEESNIAFAKLSRTVANAAQAQHDANINGKESADVFTKLGIAVTNTDGTMRTSLDIYKDVATRIQGMSDGWQKTALEMELFGRAGANLHDMLNLTKEEIDAITKKMEAMGLVMSKEDAAAAEKLDRQIKGLTGTMASLGRGIGTEVFPMIKGMVDSVSGLVKAFVSLDPETRSTILSIVKLAVEIGLAITVITKAANVVGGMATALGVMSGATIAAAGPWIALAAAIGLALYQLRQYAAEEPAADLAYRRTQSGYTNTPEARADYEAKTLERQLRQKSAAEENERKTQEVPTPDMPIYSAGGGGGGGAEKGKTALEQYREEIEKIQAYMKVQVDFGEITKQQQIDTLKSQLDGLKAVAVGADEELEKKKAVYELMATIREAQKEQIEISMSMSERDYAARKINEEELFNQKSANLQKEIDLTTEGTKERYDAEKALFDLQNQYRDKELSRQLERNEEVKNYKLLLNDLQKDEIAHNEAMEKIGYLGKEADLIKKYFEQNKKVLQDRYLLELEESNKRIELYRREGEFKKDELAKEQANNKQLTQKYNNDRINLQMQYEERVKQSEQTIAEKNHETLMELVHGTKTLHDVLLDQWDEFLNKLVQKMFRMKEDTNVFQQILGGIFGMNSSGSSSDAFQLGNGAKLDPNFGFGSLFGRANGGSVRSGQAYIVGERRPELFIPDTNGTIIPDLSNMGVSAGGKGDVTVNVINNTGQEAQASVKQSFDMSGQIIEVTLDALNRNKMGLRDAVGAVRGR